MNTARPSIEWQKTAGYIRPELGLAYEQSLNAHPRSMPDVVNSVAFCLRRCN